MRPCWPALPMLWLPTRWTRRIWPGKSFDHPIGLPGVFYPGAPSSFSMLCRSRDPARSFVRGVPPPVDFLGAAIIVEPITTPLHPQRYDWAREKLETIDEDARRMFRVFLVSNKNLTKSDIENMDNSTLFSNLENILDEFILADSSN